MCRLPPWLLPLGVLVGMAVATLSPAGAAPDGSLPATGWWRPEVGTTFQLQFQGLPDLSIDAGVYDLDLFDTPSAIVASLHAAGRRALCYINVGAWENWRPDQDQFPAAVIGQDYAGWPGEKWLDVRQIELLAPIMRARFDQCRDKGFDGIDPDNLDGYLQDTGFPISAADQLRYNLWLATEAHARGLGIGLKNDPDQARGLLPYFDWALTESCFAQDWCAQLLPFIEARKPVFAVEYTDTGMTLDRFCGQAAAMGFSAILKNRNLDAFRAACPTLPAAPEAVTAAVVGNTVTLSWIAGQGTTAPDSYVIEAGTSPGTTVATLPVGNVTAYTLAGPDGVFYVRIRAQAGGLLSAPSGEIIVRVGTAAVPGAPTNLLTSVSGAVVSFAWMAPAAGGTPSGYLLQAAMTPGGSPIAVLPTPASQTSVTVPGSPASTYYIHVVGVGPAGEGPPSAEARVTIPGQCAAPQAVRNLRAHAAGQTVAVEWDLPAGGDAPTSYVLEAGLSPGASNAALLSITARGLAAAAPPGTYYVRVKALNLCGAGPATDDLSVTVS